MEIERIKQLLTNITPLIGLLSTTIIFFRSSVKNKSLRKLLTKSEEILSKIVPSIEEAESFINYSGEEKKEYVLTKLNRYALENNIFFDNEVIEAKIEEYIRLTKTVNTGKPKNSNKIVPINKTDDIVDAIKNIINELKEE